MSLLSMKDYYYQEKSIVDTYYNEQYEQHYALDGIINPYKMFEDPNRARIVMLLKESNNYENDKVTWHPLNLDPKGLYPTDTDGSKVWARNICRSVHYIEMDFCESQWWECIPKNDPNYTVSGFAYINVKKNDEGKGKTENWDLNRYAIKDAPYLRRQIIACRPDLVFCCQKGGTQLKRLETILSQERKPIEGLDYAFLFDYNYQGFSQSLIALDWFHPSRNNISIYEMKSRLDNAYQVIREVISSNRKLLL